MRGIEIVFKKHTDLSSFLCLHKLDLTNYKFYCIDSSVYNHSGLTELQNSFTANQLIEILKSKIVIERLHLQAYPLGIKPVDIVTYDDYLNSLCDMIILAYDGVYLEIYTKNQQWLNQLLISVNGNDIESMIIKSDDTDVRTAIYV